MQQTILVPLDGSERAEAVLPPAIALGRATGSGLALLQVVAPLLAAANWMGVDRELEEAEAQAHAYLEQVAARIRAPGLPVTTETAIGYPATRIVQVASQNPQITRIAMATHGQGGVTRLVFGSIAEQVLRATSVPLLLVGAGQAASPPAYAGGTILVPLDGSSFARQALSEAQVLARPVGAMLLLVSVLPPDEPLAPVDAAGAPFHALRSGQDWLSEARQRDADRITLELDRTAQQLEVAGLRAQTHLAHGDPVAQLAKVAADHAAALIVMATHGRSGLAQIFLGSVALGLVCEAAVPVLLVRPLQLMHQRYELANVVAKPLSGW